MLQHGEALARRGEKERSDELIDLGADVCDWALEAGWDVAYGGLYYFVDCEGFSPTQLEVDREFERVIERIRASWVRKIHGGGGRYTVGLLPWHASQCELVYRYESSQPLRSFSIFEQHGNSIIPLLWGGRVQHWL